VLSKRERKIKSLILYACLLRPFTRINLTPNLTPQEQTKKYVHAWYVVEKKYGKRRRPQKISRDIWQVRRHSVLPTFVHAVQVQDGDVEGPRIGRR
jgi:hypothetical protein